MLDELIKQDFNEFKNDTNNLIPLYHCTDKIGLEGIKSYGASREFTGKNSNFYGQGFYTTFKLGSAMNNQGSLYGRYIIKFGLAGGFKNFLFFDEEMNKKYNNGEPIKKQIERLCPPDIVQKLIKNDFFNKSNFNYGKHHFLKKKLSAHGAREFFLILKGNPLSKKQLTPWQNQQGCCLYDELDISKTKVRGYIFIGSNDGEVCVVRDFNSLIPLAYFDPNKGTNPKDPNDSGWFNILNQDTFNTIAKSVDIGTDIRGQYPETPLNTKTICGYILVKGKPSGKYNYVNVDTMEELLPIPADYATDFDPDTEKAKFIINGEEYEYFLKNNIFIEDGCFTYTKDEFIEELNNNATINESLVKALSLINKINNL